MIWRKLLTVGAVTCSLIGLAPSTVSAEPGSGVGIAGCQPARAALQYVYVGKDGHLAVWHKECSQPGGYSLNSLGYMIQTRGWSGFFIDNGQRRTFAPNQDIRVNGQVTRITLNP